MRVVPKQLCTLLLLTLSAHVYAGLPDMTFEHLTTRQGLLGNEVHCVLQDSRGYLWFGTEKGLNKFDGYGFTVYKHEAGNPSSIVDAKVQSLWEDKQGTLWVGTWQGLEKFDRASNTFTLFLPDPQAPAGDWSNVIYDLREDKSGTLWVGGDGLKAFDRSTGKFTFLRHDSGDSHSLLHNHVNAIYEDKSGTLWIGTGGGLEQIDRSTGKFAHYWRDKDMHSGFFPDWGTSVHWIQSIYEDHNGILWLCTNAGPVAFDRKTDVFKPYHIYRAEPDSSAPRSVSSICEDESGILWIGTWGGGLMAYDAQGDSFVSYHRDPALARPNSICALKKDRAGTLWIGTIENGVVKAVRTESRFTPFVHDGRNPTGLSNNDVRFIYQDQNRITIGTALGTDEFDRRPGVFHDNVAWERPYSITGAFRSRSGILWTGISYDGINRIQDNPYRRKFYSTRQAGLGGSACSIFEDRSGLVWMLISNTGLCQFDPRTEQFKNLSIGQTQSPVSARSIVEDSIDNTAKGWALWIGTTDGLWRYDAGQDAFTRFGHDPKDPASLSSNTVTTVFRDSHGTLWIGTDQGLNRMDSTKGRFESYTENNGLPDNLVLGILEDEHNRLWLSTPKAISELDPQTKRFISYGMKGVLTDIRFGPGCCMRSTVGEMYFGGEGGFVIFNPDSIRENLYAPPLVITGFKKFDAPVTLDSTISEKKVIELSYKTNVFSFEFIALNFTHPEENQYAYKLEGHDNDWIYCGNQQYARYINVDEGKYVFRVKGSNNDGVWNEEGASIAVVITPPWWKTTWFTVFLWVSIASSIGGTVRYVEVRKLKKKIDQLERERALEHERARISQDMHDEVGSSLSEISILSELAKKKPEEAGAHIQEISERAAEVIDSVSEIVWAMNPKNDTLDNLVAHVRRYSVKYLSLARIGCKFIAPDAVPSTALAAEVRRNLFLVVKETLHNVVKHSKATEVTITVRCGENKMEILIADNGSGFVIDERQGTGNGLTNMVKRMADVGGTCTIQSRPDHGTIIALAIPMQTERNSA